MRVLLATDGSPFSLSAARMAGQIAGHADDTIDILSVAHAPDSTEAAVPTATHTVEREQDDKASRALDSTKTALGTDDAKIETLVVHGDAAEAIVRQADAADVDMVIMGRRGRGRVRRALLGSVSLQVLHSTHRTLLLGPPERKGASAPDRIETILFATDESAYAAACADLVSDVAQRTGARVVVLTTYHVSGAGALGSSAGEVLQHMEGDARRAARDVVGRLQKDGVEAEPLVKQASPATAILDVAKDREIDLIALGRRGLRAGKRLFLGSTSTRVAQEADTAVLVAAAEDA